MLFHHISDPHSGIDVEQIIIDYPHALDVPALQTAWQLVVDRHPSLRTRFILTESGEAFQEVHDQATITIEQKAELGSETEFEHFATEDRLRGFDLARAPLLRLSLFQSGTQGCRLVWTVHHIVLDGRAFVLVLNEVEQIFRQLVAGQKVELPAGAAFQPYVEWIERLDHTGEREFWAGKLKGLTAPTPLLQDPDADRCANRYGEIELQLSESATTALREIASRHQFTLNTIIMGVWGLLLGRYGGGDDVLFGATKTTRKGSISGAEEIVGLLLNTIPVRMKIAPDEPFVEVLGRLYGEWVSLRGHEHASLVKIKEASELPAISPLFDSLVVFENRRLDTVLGEIDAVWKTRRCTLREQTNYSLTFLAYGDPALSLKLEFDARKYARTTAERILGHARQLLESFAADPQASVGSLQMLPDAERHRLLIEWNQTQRPYPREVPLAKLIEEQVARSPDAVAVVFGTQSISYGELNERANRLACELRKDSIGPDSLVAVCLERSIDLCVALLAVIKAGAAYLPLDPSHPPARLRQVIADSGARLILSEKALRPLFAGHPGTVIEVDDPGWLANRSDNLNVPVDPENLAYVIYTSGSTGKPKGVEITRGALMNLLWCMRDWLQLNDRDRLLAVTTISFDIAGVDIWLPWLVGARTVLASREQAADGSELTKLIAEHDITFLQATPVTWRLLLLAGWQGKNNLQAVCTGEAMPSELAGSLPPLARRVWNLYGPTETTIWSVGCEVASEEKVLIGRPLANTRCYVLDEQGRPVPPGAIGELCLAGDGLARGYRNQPDLTRTRFVPNPFEAGARMYRTGDIARYHRDGNLECLGRTDQQVKIRGFRIELGEIEALLQQQPGIRQAVVALWQKSAEEKRLVAYLVPSEGVSLEREALLRALRRQLPDYMVPADCVIVSAIPISANGKVDRKALPPPESLLSATPPAGRGVPPCNGTERKLAEIFATVLNQKTVGIQDDFFDLGGHSLTAMQAVSRINTEFGVPLHPRILFQAHTVSELAALIEEKHDPNHSARPEEWPALIPIQSAGSRPPLFCVARPNVNAMGFLILSRELGPDQPVFGLQKQLAEDPVLEFSPEQIRTTATEYVHALRGVQPRGPYHLIGFCQGAYIAFDMVRQLEAEGEQVGLLGMLDVWPEENTRIKWCYMAAVYLKKAWSPLARFGKFLQARLSGPTASEGVVPKLPSGGTTQSQWKLYWPGPDFKPPVVSAPITVFRTAHQAWYRIRDEQMGWGSRTRGGVTMEHVPGDHFSLLRQPHVRVLARMLAAKIARRPPQAATSFAEANCAPGDPAPRFH
jgi:amino acid adenylation domain-containing protein